MQLYPHVLYGLANTVKHVVRDQTFRSLTTKSLPTYQVYALPFATCVHKLS